MELDSTQSYFHYKWLKISLICIVLFVKIMEIYLNFKLRCVELKNSNSCIITRI